LESFHEIVLRNKDFLAATIKKHSKKFNECVYWNGFFCNSETSKVPIIKFKPFDKYGKSLLQVVWILRWNKALFDGYVVTRTCNNAECIAEEHVVAVPKSDFYMFCVLKSNNLLKGIVTPGSKICNPRLRDYYSKYKKENKV
jgi:hypothetical protein